LLSEDLHDVHITTQLYSLLFLVRSMNYPWWAITFHFAGGWV